MKRSTIWILTVVMAIALLGLLAMQLMYLEKMVAMRESQFSEIVRRSLYSVSTMLEQNETKYYLEKDLAEAEQMYTGIAQDDFYFDKSREATIDTTLNTEDPSKLRPANRNTLKDLNDSYQMKQEILKNQYMHQQGLLNEVIFTILNESSGRPINERADSATVASYLRSELEFNGLTLPFEFAIVNRSNGMVYKTSGYSPMSQQDVYTQVLFPNDPKNKQNMLNITFPSKSDYIFSSVKFLVPSLAFTFLLLGVFLYTISVAFKQKKLSEIKNDFINNMTHELKTPISSISLAAQMLNDESVNKTPQMMTHLGGIINDESKRLRFLVEKVLQMSMFDRKTASFKKKELDLNELLESIASTFSLRVEHTGGKIYTEIEAVDSAIYVDEVHFQNAITNLMDNAVKYRKPDEPLDLYIRTWNEKDRLCFSIRDTGLGIKKENVKKIFDKFYRVHTGNVHDVKGFGLGLAYVKKIINLHEGEIKCESELGKGTTFTITLPVLEVSGEK